MSSDHKKLTEDELFDKVIKASERIPTFSIWVHDKSGTEYMVMACGLKEDNCDTYVMYARAKDLKVIWLRPTEEFLNKFTRKEIK